MCTCRQISTYMKLVFQANKLCLPENLGVNLNTGFYTCMTNKAVSPSITNFSRK